VTAAALMITAPRLKFVKIPACADQISYDARRVAEMMGFPHLRVDYETNFRESVRVEDFADTYLKVLDAIPLCALQPETSQKFAICGGRQGSLMARRTVYGDRPLYAARGRPGRARSCPGPMMAVQDQSYLSVPEPRPNARVFTLFPLGPLR